MQLFAVMDRICGLWKLSLVHYFLYLNRHLLPLSSTNLTGRVRCSSPQVKQTHKALRRLGQDVLSRPGKPCTKLHCNIIKMTTFLKNTGCVSWELLRTGAATGLELCSYWLKYVMIYAIRYCKKWKQSRNICLCVCVAQFLKPFCYKFLKYLPLPITQSQRLCKVVLAQSTAKHLHPSYQTRDSEWRRSNGNWIIKL
jgi:hypothetical protein